MDPCRVNVKYNFPLATFPLRAQALQLVIYQPQGSLSKEDAQEVAAYFSECVKNSPNGGLIVYHGEEGTAKGGHIHLLFDYSRNGIWHRTIGGLRREFSDLRYGIRTVSDPEKTKHYLFKKGPENILYLQGAHYRRTSEGSPDSLPGEQSTEWDDTQCDSWASYVEPSDGDDVVGSGRFPPEGGLGSGAPKWKKTDRWANAVQALLESYQPLNWNEFFRFVVMLPAFEFLRKDLHMRTLKDIAESQIAACRIASSTWDWKTWRRYTANQENIYYPGMHFMSVEDSVHVFQRICIHNGWDVTTFIRDVESIMDRKMEKVNCLWLYGKHNAGKTLIANSIARTVANKVDIPAITSTYSDGRFNFASMIDARLALFNEGCITDQTVEKYKNLMEGQDVETDVKNKGMGMIHRTPIIWTSNTMLWDGISERHQHVHMGPILARCINYHCNTFDELKDVKGQLNPNMWEYMLNPENNILVCDEIDEELRRMVDRDEEPFDCNYDLL